MKTSATLVIAFVAAAAAAPTAVDLEKKDGYGSYKDYPSTYANYNSYGGADKSAAAAPDACAAKCLSDYRACQTKPDANQSLCASNISTCLGYTPFKDGSFQSPTACVTKPAAPAPSADACSTKCLSDYRACQTAPNANQAVCASNISTCLGYTPFKDGSFQSPTACVTKPAAPAPSADACSTKCLSDYRACQTAPNANQSLCASNISKCLGYTPFKDGSFQSPTACAANPAPAANGYASYGDYKNVNPPAGGYGSYGDKNGGYGSYGSYGQYKRGPVESVKRWLGF